MADDDSKRAEGAAQASPDVPEVAPVTPDRPPVRPDEVPDPNATVLFSEAFPKPGEGPDDGAADGGDQGETVLYPRLDRDADLTDDVAVPYLTPELSHGAQLQGQVPVGDYDSPAARAKAADHPHDNVPGEGKSRSHARPILAALVLLVVLGIAAAGVSWGMELWGGRTIPRVAGKTQAVATQDLESRGFAVSVEERPVDDAIGKAIETSPEAGSRQEEGSQVTLVVGVARTIPQVSGMTLDEAKQALQEAGAQNFQISYASSDGAEGTVIAVDPPEGSAFVSRDTVTITISQPYTVPYVLGKAEAEAKQAVMDAGLSPHVTYVPSDKAAGTVVAVSPDQGTRITSDATVELSVSQPQPSDYRHLLEYFSCAPKVLSSYLASQGFGIQSSYVDDEGLAAALFASADHGTLTVTSTPFLPGLASSQGAGEDVLADGTNFGGVRLDLAASDFPADLVKSNEAAKAAVAAAQAKATATSATSGQGDAAATGEKTDQGEAAQGEKVAPVTPPTPSESDVKAVMATCGFDNLQQTASSDTMAQLPVAKELPEGTSFACAYGDAGNGLCWSVLIVRQGDQASVVAMAAEKALYDGYDLTDFGGNLCGLIAYADLTSR